VKNHPSHVVLTTNRTRIKQIRVKKEKGELPGQRRGDVEKKLVKDRVIIWKLGQKGRESRKGKKQQKETEGKAKSPRGYRC